MTDDFESADFIDTTDDLLAVSDDEAIDYDDQDAGDPPEFEPGEAAEILLAALWSDEKVRAVALRVWERRSVLGFAEQLGLVLPSKAR